MEINIFHARDLRCYLLLSLFFNWVIDSREMEVEIGIPKRGLYERDKEETTMLMRSYTFSKSL